MNAMTLYDRWFELDIYGDSRLANVSDTFLERGGVLVVLDAPKRIALFAPKAKFSEILRFGELTK